MIPDFLARLKAAWFTPDYDKAGITEVGDPEWASAPEPTPIHEQAVFVCARTRREAEDYMADMRLPRHRLRYVSKESHVRGIKGVKCIMLGYWHYLPDSHYMYQVMRAHEWQLEYVH